MQRGMALRCDCFLHWKHCYVIFQLSFCLSLFFSLSDVRCLKGKDKLEGESVTQMERSVANCTWRSLSSQLSSV